MKKTTNSICYSFDEQSIITWKRQEFGNKNGISLSEDSITDFNLLELQIEHPYEIRTQTYSNTEEGKNGADWEWWLGSNHNWLGLRIQAKKLDGRSLTYGELDHTNSKGRQIDILIEEALNEYPPRIPLYVFYNYWNTTKVKPKWECDHEPQCFEILGHEEFFGCAFSYANHVKKILDTKGKKLDDIIKVSYPWSCLICCHKFSKDSMDLPHRALSFVKKRLKFHFEDENNLEKRFIGEDIPDYVIKIMNGDSLSVNDWEQSGVNKITVIYQRK